MEKLNIVKHSYTYYEPIGALVEGTQLYTTFKELAKNIRMDHSPEMFLNCSRHEASRADELYNQSDSVKYPNCFMASMPDQQSCDNILNFWNFFDRQSPFLSLKNDDAEVTRLLMSAYVEELKSQNTLLVESEHRITNEDMSCDEFVAEHLNWSAKLDVDHSLFARLKLMTELTVCQRHGQAVADFMLSNFEHEVFPAMLRAVYTFAKSSIFIWKLN